MSESESAIVSPLALSSSSPERELQVWVTESIGDDSIDKASSSEIDSLEDFSWANAKEEARNIGIDKIFIL